MVYRVSGLGSKDPNNRVLGPKYHNINGIWALKPYYLGPWTLRDSSLKVWGLKFRRSGRSSLFIGFGVERLGAWDSRLRS